MTRRDRSIRHALDKLRQARNYQAIALKMVRDAEAELERMLTAKAKEEQAA